VNVYLLASVAAVAVAAALLLSLSSPPKPVVAPQCSDCDFVLEGMHSLIIASGRAYLVRGAELMRPAVLAEYAWAYTPQGPRNITCPERIWVSVRQGIAFADCQPFTPSSTLKYSSNTKIDVVPTYLKITVRYYMEYSGGCRNNVIIYVHPAKYWTCSSVYPATTTVYFDRVRKIFLTSEPSPFLLCSNVTVTSIREYRKTFNYCDSYGCSYIAYLNINGLSFRGEGYVAEYGMTMETDIGETVTVAVFDAWIADWHQGADVLELSLCGYAKIG